MESALEIILKVGGLVGIGGILGTIVTNYQKRKKTSAETDNIEIDGVSKTNREWENLYKKLQEQAEGLQKNFDEINVKYLAVLSKYQDAQALAMSLETIIKGHEIKINEQDQLISKLHEEIELLNTRAGK